LGVPRCVTEERNSFPAGWSGPGEGACAGSPPSFFLLSLRALRSDFAPSGLISPGPPLPRREAPPLWETPLAANWGVIAADNSARRKRFVCRGGACPLPPPVLRARAVKMRDDPH